VISRHPFYLVNLAILQAPGHNDFIAQYDRAHAQPCFNCQPPHQFDLLLNKALGLGV
jgi:hypothetical protein